MAGEVHPDGPEVDHRRQRHPRRLAAPQDGTDARRQLPQAERLRDVVVRAELQPDDLVDLGVPRRQHHDRDAGFGPDLARHLEPGQLGQHQVEQHEVRLIALEALERGAAVGRLDDAESVGLQGLGERLAQRRLVLDDEDRLCHAPESTGDC